MHIFAFKGSPDILGKTQGSEFCEQIKRNIDILIKNSQIPLNNSEFKKWIDIQEKIIIDNWPWLFEEMQNIAAETGVKYRNILLLNLRAWQYKFYANNPHTTCSSMVIVQKDGTIANAGALDDRGDIYCGLVKYYPDDGYSFMTFPVSGTCWGNRGVNSAGLCVGTSSQILQNLPGKPDAICADIANRVILQTCATVNEVKKLCRLHPFTLNLVCSDRNGDVFCAHNTSAGLFNVIEDAPYAMTNHVVDDRLILKLTEFGVSEFYENATTRPRRGRLLEYILSSDKHCHAEDIRNFIADRLNGAPQSICPKGNFVLTYANTQLYPQALWISEPQATGIEQWEKYSL